MSDTRPNHAGDGGRPGRPKETAPGVYRVETGRGLTEANVYLVRSGPGWVLIDTAWPHRGQLIRAAAESLFGAGTRPEAILLTHMHPDHAGSARELAGLWDLPVHVHPAELPLAAGRYLPQYGNPLDRWLIAPLLALMPRRAVRASVSRSSLEGTAVPFDPAAGVPGLPDWRAVPTPGHTPGHVAFFRSQDRVLITGDAVLTVNLNSVPDLLTGKHRVAGPPYISTWDWPAAKESVAALAGLKPDVLACGHGRPMTGARAATGLASFSVYSNHGFAALGQIVEDVSGEPFERYLRGHIFGPLEMDHTDLALSGQLRAGLATGYTLRRRGLRPVTPREVPTPGGGGVYSTPADMARYLTALLHGGANEHGRVLTADSVQVMFRPHFQPDPRVAGMALGFEPHTERGRVLICKGGTISGFLSALDMAPEDGVGVVVLANTGGLDNRGIAEPLAAALSRCLLGMPANPVRDDVAPHPEAWDALRGWYAPDSGPITNLFARVGFGAGIEVAVQYGRLVLKPLTPVPGLWDAMVLHPDDPDDPRVYRVGFPRFDKTSRVVFTDDTPPRLLLDVMSFQKRPGWRNPRHWSAGIAAAGVAGAVIRRRGKK